jgi:hypothetical protein
MTDQLIYRWARAGRRLATSWAFVLVIALAGTAGVASAAAKVARPVTAVEVANIGARSDGDVALTVIVPGPGTLDILESAWLNDFATVAVLQPAKGRFAFARAHATAKRAMTLRLVVAPSARGRSLLAHHLYPVNVRVWITFTPKGGRPDNIGVYGVQLTKT